jgi:hypothetical protein
MLHLTRFWIEFESRDTVFGYGMSAGCGVTAWNYDDALNILKEKVFHDKSLPDIKKVTENIEVSTLDAGHILPNILPPSVRGIWYPMGYN